MGLLHSRIRRTLLSMQEDNIQFDKDDDRAIWRKIFVGGILRTQIYRPQYWVIDALDECINYSKLFPLLSKIESAFPIRIFITSRISPDLEKRFSQLGRQVLWNRISSSTSRPKCVTCQYMTIPFDRRSRERYLSSQRAFFSGSGLF